MSEYLFLKQRNHIFFPPAPSASELYASQQARRLLLGGSGLSSDFEAEVSDGSLFDGVDKMTLLIVGGGGSGLRFVPEHPRRPSGPQAAPRALGVRLVFSEGLPAKVCPPLFSYGVLVIGLFFYSTSHKFFSARNHID